MNQKYYSLRSFFTYLKAYRGRTALIAGGFAVSNILIALIPLFIGKLVGALGEHPPDSHQAITFVILLIAASTGHDIIWRLSEFAYVKLLNPAVMAYENILFNQTIHKPYPYFVDKFTGKLSSYITTISREAKDLMEKILWDYIDEVINLVAITAILTAVNWQTGAIFGGGIILMIIAGRITIRYSVRAEKHWTDVQSTKNGKIIDAVANFVNVKSFHKERGEMNIVRTAQDENIKAANSSFLWGMLFWGSMSFIIRELMWPAVIILNVYLFLDHQISLAALATVLSSILVFSTTVWDLIWNVSQFSLQLARQEEAYDYLFGKINVAREYRERQAAETERTPTYKQPAFVGELALTDVHFAYPDQADIPVLADISLTIGKHEKIGIVGRSGSGKTTLTKLLLDYYAMTDGRITIDGRPVTTKEISKLVSYVPQDTSLFHRSVAENIAYAANHTVTQKDIVQAATRAHADEFIRKIAGGYDALVGERGVNLSAGQRQRIAIARAFLDDKPILILDEATSALDSESEVLIQEALEALWLNKTVIAIAHRLSTLRHMDRILVMDKGRIIEQGSHQQLLNAGGHYAKLWNHQSGGFIEED